MGFTYEWIASGLHDEGDLRRALGGLEEEIRRHGGSRIEAGAQFLLIATGGVEREALRRIESRERRQPVLLLAHGRHNSLPAALEILGRVRQDGRKGRIYLLREGGDGWPALERTARCLEAQRVFAQETIGCVGEASDWLVASSQGAEAVRRRFGLKLEAIAMGEWREAMAEAAQGEDQTGIWAKAEGREVTEAAYRETMGAYRALKRVVERHGLAGVTAKCFDFLASERTTGCLALAQLADEGISAGCEGDVTAVVAMRWLWHLTGKASWMANPSDVDIGSGELLLAHCTVPLGMLERYRLKTHFESGIGVAVDGELRKGPVTLVRLGGRELEQCWTAEGELVERLHEEHRCRTQAVVRIEPARARELLDAPLGNHLVLVEGHVGDDVQESFGWLADD